MTKKTHRKTYKNLYKKKDIERINMIINNNREREEEDNLKEKNKELCKELYNVFFTKNSNRFNF